MAATAQMRTRIYFSGRWHDESTHNYVEDGSHHSQSGYHKLAYISATVLSTSNAHTAQTPSQASDIAHLGEEGEKVVHIEA